MYLVNVTLSWVSLTGVDGCDNGTNVTHYFKWVPEQSGVQTDCVEHSSQHGSNLIVPESPFTSLKAIKTGQELPTLAKTSYL